VHFLKDNNLQRFCRRVLEDISGLRRSIITLNIRSHPFLYPKQETHIFLSLHNFSLTLSFEELLSVTQISICEHMSVYVWEGH